MHACMHAPTPRWLRYPPRRLGGSLHSARTPARTPALLGGTWVISSRNLRARSPLTLRWLVPRWQAAGSFPAGKPLTMAEPRALRRSADMLAAGLSVKYYSASSLDHCLFADGVSAYDGGCVHLWRLANLSMVDSACLRGTSLLTGGLGGGVSGAQPRIAAADPPIGRPTSGLPLCSWCSAAPPVQWLLLCAVAPPRVPLGTARLGSLSGGGDLSPPPRCGRCCLRPSPPPPPPRCRRPPLLQCRCGSALPVPSRACKQLLKALAHALGCPKPKTLNPKP